MKDAPWLWLGFLISIPAHAGSQVFFSPQGGCEQAVVKLVSESKSMLDVAIYSLNNEAIVHALESAKARGVKIRILLDRVQASRNRAVTLRLKHEGFDVRIHSKNKIQHNKFAVADGKRIETGSFNWTEPAERSNEENCLTIDDPAIVSAYAKRFSEHLWVVNSEDRSIRAFNRLENGSKKRIPASRGEKQGGSHE